MIPNKLKRKFDIKDKKDVEMYRTFLSTMAWGTGGCPFELEFPYLTIPDMIKDKLIRKYLKVEQVC